MEFKLAPPPEMEEHLTQIIEALTKGRLVIFVGAGANLCDRSESWIWHKEQREFLPSGLELSHHLAETFRVDVSGDLARVAQHVVLRNGTGPLYHELRGLFDVDYPVTRLHHVLAGLPAALRSKGYPRTSDPNYRRLLLISTNFDDMLERAFDAAGEPFHSVIYEADGQNKGKFFHRSPSGGLEWIQKPNKYHGLLGDEHPVVMKFHGAVDRTNCDRDSFVITEDHYIEYLTRTEAAALIPAPLPVLLQNCRLLFLGYGLRDWNLRVILHRLWGDRKLSWKSWAIQHAPDIVDREFWRRREVEILDFLLGDYVPLFEERLQALPPTGHAAGSP